MFCFGYTFSIVYFFHFIFFYLLLQFSGGARPGPAGTLHCLERAVPRRTKWVKISRRTWAALLCGCPSRAADVLGLCPDDRNIHASPLLRASEAAFRMARSFTANLLTCGVREAWPPKLTVGSSKFFQPRSVSVTGTDACQRIRPETCWRFSSSKLIGQTRLNHPLSIDRNRAVLSFSTRCQLN